MLHAGAPESNNQLARVQLAGNLDAGQEQLRLPQAGDAAHPGPDPGLAPPESRPPIRRRAAGASGGLPPGVPAFSLQEGGGDASLMCLGWQNQDVWPTYVILCSLMVLKKRNKPRRC